MYIEQIKQNQHEQRGRGCIRGFWGPFDYKCYFHYGHDLPILQNPNEYLSTSNELQLLSTISNFPHSVRNSKIAAELTALFLALFYDNTYVHGDYLAMLVIVNLTALILQILLMIYEYNKRVPLYFGHKIYWFVNWLALVLILIMLIELDVNHIVNYAIESLRICIYSTLLIFSLFIRKQDIQEYENIKFFRTTVPDIDPSNSELRHRMSTINYGESKIFTVQVKRRWNVLNDQIEIIMEISFVGSDRKYKQKRLLNELFELHGSIIVECAEYLELHPIELTDLNNLIQQIRECAEVNLISSIQKYLGTLNAKIEFACESFLEFLRIPPQEKQLIEETKQLVNYQLNPKSSLVQKKKEVMHYKWNVEDEFLPYFRIKMSEYQNLQSHVQYTVNIWYQNDNWTVFKRFTDFYELNETLKQFLINIKGFPPLPQKKLIKLSEEEVEERMQELEVYLKNILNDRQYHHYSLFKFIQLNKEQEDILKQLQRKVNSDSLNIQNIAIQGQGYEEKDGVIRYVFLIINGVDKYQIMKRFSQFDELNQVLKVKFSNLPNLPTKFATPQQVVPKERSIQLTFFLQQLIKVSNIGESLHLRQFLDIRSLNASKVYDEGRTSSSIDLEMVFQKLEEENLRDSQKLEDMKAGW